MNQPEMKFFQVSLVLFIFDGAIASNNSTSTASRPRSLADIENPKTDPTSCGRPLQSFVCDSDQILSANQADGLDTQIADIMTSTRCACSPASTCRAVAPGYMIGVALVKKMIISATVPDKTNTNDVYVVRLNAALNEAKEIAHSLLQKWSLGQCHDGVLVFFSAGDSVLYTAVDSRARLLLTDDLVGEISMNVRLDMNRNPSRGLHNMLSAYKSVFLGNYRRTTNWDSTPDASAVVSSATHPTISSPVIRIIFILNLILTVTTLRST